MPQPQPTQLVSSFEENNPAPFLPTELRSSSIGSASASGQDAVCLDQCACFESFEVTTSHSVYQITILEGRYGEVLVRGGRFFPEYCHAVLLGSRNKGALRLKTIVIGQHLEFRADTQAVTTSRVLALRRF
jgi:hypothetical protein